MNQEKKLKVLVQLVGKKFIPSEFFFFFNSFFGRFLSIQTKFRVVEEDANHFLFVYSHAMSDSEMLRVKAANATTLGKKPEVQLPSTASWASKNPTTPIPAIPIVYNPSLPPLSATLKPPPVPRPIPVSKPQTHPLPARPSSRTTNKAEGILPSTRPISIINTTSSAEATSVTTDSPIMDIDSPILPQQEIPIASSSSNSPSSIPTTLPSLSSDTDHDFDSTITHLHSNGDILTPPSVSPFPELEFGEGTFSFSLDMDIKGKGRALPGSGQEERSSRDFANLEGFGRGSIVAGNLESNHFNGSQDLFSPILSNSSYIAPTYLGSFDPFSDGSVFENTISRPDSPSDSPPLTPDDISRRSSRFGFARRGSQGVRSSEINGGLSRTSFSNANGRESPGYLNSTSFSGQQQLRPPSSIGFSQLPPPSVDLRTDGRSIDPNTGLWPTSTNFSGGALQSGVFRGLTSPSQSSNSSPQLSPRSRATLSFSNGISNGVGGSAGLPLSSVLSTSSSVLTSSGLTSLNPPPGVTLPPSASSLPPGLSLNRTPIPAASFPLPPAAPRASGQSTPVGKEDLLALIAAAQAAPKSLGMYHFFLHCIPFDEY